MRDSNPCLHLQQEADRGEHPRLQGCIRRQEAHHWILSQGLPKFQYNSFLHLSNTFYEYLPHITSYDYDCPINEQGRPT